MVNIGKYIRSVRKKKGITVSELSDATNLSPEYIYMIETQHRSPSVKKMWRISSYLKNKKLFDKYIEMQKG